MKYKYTVVESANGKLFYLARQMVGTPTLKVVGIFHNAETAKLAAAAMNA